MIIISFVDVDFKVNHYKVQGTSSGDKRARDGRGFTEKFNFKNVREAVDCMLSKFWVKDMTPLKPTSEMEMDC